MSEALYKIETNPFSVVLFSVIFSVPPFFHFLLLYRLEFDPTTERVWVFPVYFFPFFASYIAILNQTPLLVPIERANWSKSFASSSSKLTVTWMFLFLFLIIVVITNIIRNLYKNFFSNVKKVLNIYILQKHSLLYGE